MGRALPDDFILGCATSAYQVEGGIENDWEAWARAGRLHVPGARCGLAADHWARYLEDFDRLAALGAQAYRFSVEWARVEPEPGRYDAAALDQYREMAEALRARGIEPFVTLLHFTHPPWFHELSPWHAATGDAARRFERFADRVLTALGSSVRYFTVLNEPNVWLAAAYLAGVIPPGRRSYRELTVAATNLLRAHRAASRRIRVRVPDAQVGVAHHVLRFAPARPEHPLDRGLVRYAHRVFNHGVPAALTALKDSIDFLGINYYSRAFVEARLWPRPGLDLFYEDREGRGVTDLGWEIHPGGLTEILGEMARYRRPMFITENGLDDRSDTRRAAFLYDHLDATLAAREAGADIRGYLFWSLMDNFEWLEAFGPRFGLLRVDYETQDRTETRGARLFREVAQARVLPDRRPAETRRPGRGRRPVG